MKALCVSDLHGQVGFLLALDNLLKREKIDLVLSVGDIGNAGRNIEYSSKFLKILKQNNSPVFSVPGNNDFGEIYDLLKSGTTLVENKLIKFGGEKIIGMGGIPDLYGHNIFPPEVKDEDLADSIFLSHIPPNKIENIKKFDWKPKKFSRLKLKAAPKIQISGHIHYNWGVAWIGRTKILKLPAGANMMATLLDTKTLEVNFIDMKKYDNISLNF